MNKAVISWVVVALGIALGIVFLVLVGPLTLFTLGKNDSWIEVLGVSALVLSVFPACIYATYNRLFAGIWLTGVGSYAAIALMWNNYEVLAAKGIHGQIGEVIGNGFVGMLAMGIGIFFWVTGATGWPDLKGRRSHKMDHA
jgi:hypothetical protein